MRIRPGADTVPDLTNSVRHSIRRLELNAVATVTQHNLFSLRRKAHKISLQPVDPRCPPRRVSVTRAGQDKQRFRAQVAACANLVRAFGKRFPFP